ncbi:hypothetical protein ACEZDB_01965 [Streptacidiphilus sp. N1-3]|uniref:Uncharacterized protein n=1 Tax=Streptacidiphilus alkalitolerans TaxID=3342712 RepID=A0ABV6WTQ6_9ACTN
MAAQVLPHLRRQQLADLHALGRPGPRERAQHHQRLVRGPPLDITADVGQDARLPQPVGELRVAAELLAQRGRAGQLAGQGPAGVAGQRVLPVGAGDGLPVPRLRAARPVAPHGAGELPRPCQLPGRARGPQQRQQLLDRQLLGQVEGGVVRGALPAPPQGRRQRHRLGAAGTERHTVQDVPADRVAQLAHVEGHGVPLRLVAAQHPQPDRERRLRPQQPAQLARRSRLPAERAQPGRGPPCLRGLGQLQQAGQRPPVPDRPVHATRPPSE